MPQESRPMSVIIGIFPAHKRFRTDHPSGAVVDLRLVARIDVVVPQGDIQGIKKFLFRHPSVFHGVILGGHERNRAKNVRLYKDSQYSEGEWGARKNSIGSVRNPQNRQCAAVPEHVCNLGEERRGKLRRLAYCRLQAGGAKVECNYAYKILIVTIKSRK